jgi:CDP-6-deoxy-D-xylo-4-hexulose-3-dehydrase
VQLRNDRLDSFRVVGALGGADEIMQTTLFLGIFPGLTNAMIDYEIDVIRHLVSRR